MYSKDDLKRIFFCDLFKIFYTIFYILLKNGITFFCPSNIFYKIFHIINISQNINFQEILDNSQKLIFFLLNDVDVYLKYYKIIIIIKSVKLY